MRFHSTTLSKSTSNCRKCMYKEFILRKERKKFSWPRNRFCKVKKYEPRKFKLITPPVITVNEELLKESFLNEESENQKEGNAQESVVELFDFGSCDENVFFSNSAYWDNLMKSFTRHK